MNNMVLSNPSSFFSSSLDLQNRFQSFASFQEWFESKCRPDEFLVERTPLEQLKKWRFDDGKNRLFHESGRFFSIEGIHVKTNFGKTPEWDQPIINQPEIGILGIITKIFDGVRYFLMQAKMEPGNINILQLSPTVQATKSNFSRVHQGKLPAYLEYFTGGRKVRILVDQLQSEQGGRFFQKRNRNVIVEVFDDIEVYDDFCWLTLAELKLLLQKDNVLNMDTRSVLSTIPLIDENILNDFDKIDITGLSSVNGREISEIGRDYIGSYISGDALYGIDDIISWYNQQKIVFELEVARKPLSQLRGWVINANAIHSEKNFFSVIGVSVCAGTREVTQWMQPLIEDTNTGLLAFVTKKINGILHFLIQAKVEPGNRDIIELSPTVSCSNYNHIARQEQKPFMFDEVFNSDNAIHFDSLQSEEGGRFYQIQNRNMIVELTRSQEQPLPANFIWMTLMQMKEFMRYGMFNIEARSIVSAINFIEK
jgi:oxidase EvaA